MQHWKYCRINWAQYYGTGTPSCFPNTVVWENLTRTHWQSAGDPSPTQKLLVICSVARAATVGVELAPGTPQDPWQAWRRHISRFSISGGFSRLQSDWMNRNVSKGNLRKETQDSNIWHPSFLVEPGFPGSARDKATPLTQNVVKRIPQPYQVRGGTKWPKITQN